MSRRASSPDFSDVTPVEPIALDDPSIGAREYARRAANHALAAHHSIGRVAREVADLKEDVKTLLRERSAAKRWKARAVNVVLGIATIVGAAGIAHVLHWGP